jgi:hypothetical protein
VKSQSARATRFGGAKCKHFALTGCCWLLSALTGCVGTTGGDLIEFDAYATGPKGVTAGTYSFVTSRGFDVSLDRARLFIGALYLNRSVATSVASDTTCTLPGVYVAEVTEGLTVDLLSSELQVFPQRGYATTDFAPTGEVWLSRGDVSDEGGSGMILELRGRVRSSELDAPFLAELTIGSNRVLPASNPALPGAKPICKQRIVSPITADIQPTPGGRLVLQVDPAGMFSNVDFTRVPVMKDGTLEFADDSTDPASDNLFNGLRASGGVYTFQWEP